MQTEQQCDSPADRISLFLVQQISSQVTVNRRTDTGVNFEIAEQEIRESLRTPG
jgi:hypothetical protein